MLQREQVKKTNKKPYKNTRKEPREQRKTVPLLTARTQAGRTSPPHGSCPSQSSTSRAMDPNESNITDAETKGEGLIKARKHQDTGAGVDRSQAGRRQAQVAPVLPVTSRSGAANQTVEAWGWAAPVIGPHTGISTQMLSCSPVPLPSQPS